MKKNQKQPHSLNVVYVPIDELVPAGYNPRKLSEKQAVDIKKSLEKFGFVDPIVVNCNESRKNVIVGGHQRVYVAKRIGIKEVPCVLFDLSEEEERELNIRLNKNTGEWDLDALTEFFVIDDLKEWGFEGFDFGMDLEEGSSKDASLDVDDFDTEHVKIELNYTLEEHAKVLQGLFAIAKTPEAAVWKLLGFENQGGCSDG